MLRKTSTGCRKASLIGVAVLAAATVSCRPLQVDSLPAGTSDPDMRDEPLPKPPRDSTFYRFCLGQFDLDSDGVLSDGETAGVTVLDLQTSGLCYEVRNLDGVERFADLEVLRVSCDARIIDSYGEMLPPEKWNYRPGQLQDLDLSSNHRLKELYCKGHGIAGLSFAEDAPLEVVECSYNCIESLDLSGCDALVSVNACDNRISSVKADGLPCMNEAFFSSNVISEFSIGACPQLQNLQVADNKLLSIDLSPFPKLSKLVVDGNKLATLETGVNPGLTTISCDRNRIESLDLSRNRQLKNLRCSENLLSLLDISMLERLSSLDCSPMNDGHSQNTLKKLLIFKGQSIRYVTYERNDKYVPEGTEIVSIKSE